MEDHFTSRKLSEKISGDITLYEYETSLCGWHHDGFVRLATAKVQDFNFPHAVINEVSDKLNEQVDSMECLCIHDFFPYGWVPQSEIDGFELSRKGLGSRSLNEILDYFPPADFSIVFLNSPISDLHRFFENNGFNLIKEGCWYGFKVRSLKPV